MGMGAGQAAALAPDLGRAKPAMQSIFALIDRVGGVSFFISYAVEFFIFGIFEMRVHCADPAYLWRLVNWEAARGD